LAELIPAGVEAVLAAFRTALCSLAVRNDIEGPSHDRHRSWSAVVNAPEKEASVLIQRFVLDKVSKDKMIQVHVLYDGG
jgi:naphtho-gamma-pyrone polyketide synthase